ncbi:MAG: Acyl carrier protein [Chlamydiia bacterium]|nr:Acyl carrier protein [Chlamydiia bacterium]MCH9618007.1 Acyl carrier protein [Chlamydiia bacterium]MCH9623668.1 Acyl carrier protein [Chlamydiia bacterium]
MKNKQKGKKMEDIEREIEKEIVDIVVEQLGVDASEVTREKSFVEDLNADSLDQTELIMTFEEKLNLEISEEEATSLKTVGDVIQYILQKQSLVKN